MFEDFYARYPRKKEPRKARAKYEQALTRATHEEIMAGVENLISAGWDDIQFVKYPATWLHNDCWLDEYEDPRIEKTFEENRTESELYHLIKTGEWRGSENTEPTREEAIERLRRAGGWDDFLDKPMVIQGGKR